MVWIKASVSLLMALPLACASLRPEQRLLERGKPTLVLKRVRPDSAPAVFLRARAQQRLGHLARARREILLGLSMDPRSAEGHRLLGFLELELGNRGAALNALQRSLRLDRHQPCVMQVAARLLVLRARLSWPKQHARRDLDRAIELDPCLKARIGAMSRSWPRLSGGCVGEPPPDRPLPRQGCRLPRPERFLERLARRHLLLSCDGARLARRLMAHGCVRQAREVLLALEREDPLEPAWALELARIDLALGHQRRAEQRMMSYIYLRDRDRADAMLVVARLMLSAGLCRSAARQAVESMPFARSLQQQLDALRLIHRCGLEHQARQAGRYITERGWSMPQKGVERRVREILSEPNVPRTPRR